MFKHVGLHQIAHTHVNLNLLIFNAQNKSDYSVGELLSVYHVIISVYVSPFKPFPDGGVCHFLPVRRRLHVVGEAQRTHLVMHQP